MRPEDATHWDVEEKCYLKVVGGTLWYRFPDAPGWSISSHKDGPEALTKYSYCVPLDNL